MIAQTPHTRLGRYEIIGPLGAGGMGSVHLAYDPGLDREVAIKVLRGQVVDEELRARFLREARATANLHHPNIITIFEVGEHAGQPFIAMEYVAGQSLATLIAQQRTIPLAKKLTYLEQICAGLEFAHRAGIVHRDVKPANLMVDAQDVIRILDFGIARLAGSGMTMDGALIGSINYMSPEQMLGRRVDHRSDIFAAGAVAYELISYCQAFPGTLDELLQRLPNEPPVALRSICPDLDAEIVGIITQALEKDPGRRFGDLSEMQAALARVRTRIETHLGPAFVVPTPAAAAALASTLRLRPGTAARADDAAVQAQLHAASKCLDTGDPAGAAEIAQRLIERVPSSIEAHALLVRAHRAMAGSRARGGSPVEARSTRRTAAIGATGVALAGVAAVIATMTGMFGERTSETPAVERGPAPMTRVEPPPVNGPVPNDPASPAPASTAPASTAPPPALPLPAPPATDAALEGAARDRMVQLERARLGATRADARELAPERFAAAAASAERARRAQARGDYAELATVAVTATRQFTEALAEAEQEAERRRMADARTRAAAPGSSNVPVLPSGPTSHVTVPAPNTNLEPATPPAAPLPTAPPAESSAPAVVNPIVRERPAILATLENYGSAHQQRNISALKGVYPALAGEQLQAKERWFKDKRTCLGIDVEFGEPVISLTADATVAHVNVMSTYSCTPPTGQPRPQQPLPDVFQMRKTGESWVITVMGAMGR